MTSLLSYLPLFLYGASVTLASWFAAGSISFIIGTVLAIAASQYSNFAVCKTMINVYVFITKGIPAYVQILIAYFVVPSLLQIHFSGFIAASFALGICSSGYMTDIIRSGINAIPQGQWDACFMLGYPKSLTLKRIIMPQAFSLILPSVIGELEQLLKSTSLLATIGVTELTRTGMNIISRELNPLPIYFMIALIYLSFSAILNIIVVYAKGSYGYRR